MLDCLLLRSRCSNHTSKIQPKDPRHTKGMFPVNTQTSAQARPNKRKTFFVTLQLGTQQKGPNDGISLARHEYADLNL